jgi:hypothetical protein
MASIGLIALAFGATNAHADLRSDVARCAAIVDGAARLACFDTLAGGVEAPQSAARDAAIAALSREFRFDRGLMTGPLSFRVAVSGNLVLSRETAAAREVEDVVRRIARTIDGSNDWRVAVTVHGGKAKLSRGHPYTGEELLAQARAGMASTGLAETRYTVTRGADAEPVLWDDGRVRSANEHIEIEIEGFGNGLTR